jgi:hypothetical protein
MLPVACKILLEFLLTECSGGSFDAEPEEQHHWIEIIRLEQLSGSTHPKQPVTVRREHAEHVLPALPCRQSPEEMELDSLDAGNCTILPGEANQIRDVKVACHGVTQVEQRHPVSFGTNTSDESAI